jgi:hypothetical protein
MMNSKSFFAGGVLAVLTLAAAAKAAPFSDGDFESPTAPPSPGYIIYGPGTGPGPWIFGTDANSPNGGVLWTASGGPVGPAPEGSQFVSLNDPSGLGSISQTFDTTTGASYTVKFKLSGIGNGTGDAYNVNVSATGAGNTTTSYGYNTLLAPNLFVPPAVVETYSFVGGAGSSTKLTFSSTVLSSSAAYYGPVIDAVSVTPEPASLGLLGLCAAGLLARHRRD